MESVLKDAECTFGILKKRWRILKIHMLIHKKAGIDSMVFTCAIIHNMLLSYDEYDEWNDEDDNCNVAADIPEYKLYNMDPKIINLREGPAGRSYAGGGNIMDIEVETTRKRVVDTAYQSY